MREKKRMVRLPKLQAFMAPVSKTRMCCWINIEFSIDQELMVYNALYY